MIDSNEPKDGDFVRYVDDLMRMPRGVAPVMGGRSPGEAARDTKTLLASPKTLIEGLRKVLVEAQRVQAQRGGTQGAGGADSSAPGAKPAPLAPHKMPAPHTMSAPRRARAGTATSAAAGISRAISRVASFAIFAAVVLLAMSFADDPPLEIDPFVGIALLVGAAVLKRVSRGIA
ncbi:MAG: hypothetical protein KJZ83_19105 [Burkholderiaceae bacterium]|nr:hypothetical protein [Burkholderiaceae bacterium]